MPALITQELKFNLLKLNQIIKCLFSRFVREGAHPPAVLIPQGYIVNDGSPLPPPPPPPQISNPR